MFADIEGGKTKSQQETDYQALDAATAANHRNTRNTLLARQIGQLCQMLQCQMLKTYEPSFT